MVQSGLPNRYRVLEEVGQGGMAVVYRAEDSTLKREVAIKVLHAHLCSEPESKERLSREAQAVAKLHHDNILQIFDYSGSESDASYIVTEFIDGETLKQFLARRKLPVPELAALIAIEIGRALEHAHSVGILHRDVKPENVMVRKDGAIKLMDFGVAQIVDLERMTVTGQILGSPAYMAPEVLEGKPLDFRTDVFSVGIMLYQMATGALPFSGRNPHEVLKRVAEGRFADPRTINRLVSDQLARIITRALARRPEDRYASISALLDDLRVYTSDAGFPDPIAELTRFFTDPEGHEKDLQPRLVRALVASGQRERAARRTARALELWNRALALEPENATVLRELRRLEGGKRLVRVAIVAGSAAGAVGVVWGLVALAGDSRPSPLVSSAAAPAHPAPLSPPPNAPSLDSDPPKPPPQVFERTPGKGKGSTPKGARVASAPRSATGEMVTFTLTVTPKRAQVFLDDTRLPDFDPAKPYRIPVRWTGKHVLLIRNAECCADKRIELGPMETRPQGDHLNVTLSPKLAYLTVELQPETAGARVLIMDEPQPGETEGRRTTATPGEKTPISFDGDDDMRKSLQVVVSAGEKIFMEPVRFLLPGDKRTVKVALDK